MKLTRKVDMIFSEYIRRKYADENGIVKCYTCTFKDHWKYLQCGHFISRRYLILRWDENNCRPQCSSCNESKRGNIEVYEPKLISELGKEVFNELIEKKHQEFKLMPFELKEIEQKYKAKAREL